ncbi:hypothetical protein ABEF95_012457 [Exophiala dermatitidis]
MPITKTVFKNLAARVTISPPPAGLHESTAILKRLQSFGPVTSFTKTIRDPGSTDQEVQVIFSSPETAQKACDASPFAVELDQDFPDPVVVDPYNVRNLQSRRRPGPKSVTCRVRLQEQGESLGSGQTILSGGFSPSNKTRLYQSLLDVRPPQNIMDGLGVFDTDDEADVISTAGSIQPPPDLADMYRSSISDRHGADGKKQTDFASERDRERQKKS